MKINKPTCKCAYQHEVYINHCRHIYRALKNNDPSVAALIYQEVFFSTYVPGVCI